MFTPIPEDLRASIINIAFWLHGDSDDCLVWSLEVSGSYKVSSGYAWLYSRLHGDVSSESWSWVWKIPVPEKCHFLIWLSCHEALPTAVLRHRRGLASINTCSRCHDKEDDIMHCLRDCCHAKVIWEGFNLTLSSCSLTSRVG